MVSEIKPILAAQYSISYCTREFSDRWGRWKSILSNKRNEYHHDPDKKLSNGECDIASVYMPVVGVYDSADPDLCEYHILLAKAAGIEAFIVDWFGPNAQGLTDMEDKQVKVLLQMAELLDFKIAFCFHDEGCFPPYQPQVSNRIQAMVYAKECLRYAEEHYFQSKAYLRVEGQPLLILSNCGKTGSEWHWPFITLAEWSTLRADLNEKIVLVQNYQPQMGGIEFSQWDSVYPSLSIYFSEYDTDETFWEKCHSATNKGSYHFTSGLVNPGYDDRGIGGTGDRGPRVFSRRQGEKYSSIWEDNLNNHVRFVQIGTWNNHAEGTGIEPVKENVLHKSAAVPGWGYRELIATREYATRFIQKKLWPLPALFLPERLYHLRKSGAPASRGDRIRLYLLEGDVTGSTLGLEHAGV